MYKRRVSVSVLEAARPSWSIRTLFRIGEGNRARRYFEFPKARYTRNPPLHSCMQGRLDVSPGRSMSMFYDLTVCSFAVVGVARAVTSICCYVRPYGAQFFFLDFPPVFVFGERFRFRADDDSLHAGPECPAGDGFSREGICFPFGWFGQRRADNFWRGFRESIILHDIFL